MSDREPSADQLRFRGPGPTLSYEVVGPSIDLPPADAMTLLCLHGNSSHRGVWRPVARELREFRCVLLDLRGHGDSEHVSPPAYNPEHHAADLAAVVAGLVRSPYAILAHSAGALAAVQHISMNDASQLAIGQAHYSAMLYPQGTFVDDVIVHRLGDDDFLLERLNSVGELLAQEV